MISVDLPFPLGSYVKPIKEEVEQPLTKGIPKTQTVADKKPPSRDQKASEQKPPSREIKPPSRDFKAGLGPLKPSTADPSKKDDLEIYERAIYIAPYKSKELVVNLQEIINQINLEGLNIKEGGVQALATHALSEEEKTNRNYDYISGFEIIDNEFRMFVLEGLSDRGMKKYKFLIFLVEIYGFKGLN